MEKEHRCVEGLVPRQAPTLHSLTDSHMFIRSAVLIWQEHVARAGHQQRLAALCIIACMCVCACVPSAHMVF